jgi:F-type H+-transporting ATPase subunit delta
LQADQQRSVDVELTTAFEISPEAAESLGAALRTRLERDINLATKVDQALIGGAIIRTGDMVIDSSVRGKLTKLVESINS